MTTSSIVKNHKTHVSGAVLLAAGRGARLQPHTDITPKPLLPVNGAPTLDLYFNGLATAGVQNVVLVVHHLAEQIENYASKIESRFGINCTTVTQEVLNGTATALESVYQGAKSADENTNTTHTALLQSITNSPFLLTATDYLIPPTFIPDFLSFYLSTNEDIAVSIKSVPKEQLASRSSIRFSDDDQILEVVEKPAEGQAPSSYSANLTYVLPPEVLQLLTDVKASPRGEREVQTAINGYLASGGSARGLVQPAPPEWTPANR